MIAYGALLAISVILTALICSVLAFLLGWHFGRTETDHLAPLASLDEHRRVTR